MNLSTLLSTRAAVAPDEVALVGITRSWTWAEADARVGRLGAALRAAGVQVGDRVGVHLHKSDDGWLAMHAVVRIGAVAVPLDPGAPKARLERICSTMGIRVVVAHDPRRTMVQELAEVLDAVIGLTAAVDGLRTITTAEVEELSPVLPADMSLDGPAYIITTSGSTGEPKGIVHTHASGLAYARESAELYGLTPSDRVADTAPNHFDQSTFALWSAALAGSTVITMPEPHQRMPASFSERLANEAVTVWYGVPFLLQQLALRGDLDNRDLSALRWVKFGGEVPPPWVIAAICEHAPNATMANIYGPAECNQCSFHHLTAPPLPGEAIPIGVPTPSATMRLAAPDASHPGAVGERTEGEIWVAGPTLMQGYFGLDEVNAARLVEHEGVRWYRTGDLGRVDDAGTWWFLGRVDHQVKVRGHRIELEGLEAELESLPGVEHVIATVARRDGGEDSVVVGVFPAGDYDEGAFREGARSLLPPYALPTHFLTMSGKKFTGSGKLDRGALRREVLASVETE
jgi:amino acid adenylation domain-containing protein